MLALVLLGRAEPRPLIVRADRVAVRIAVDSPDEQVAGLQYIRGPESVPQLGVGGAPWTSAAVATALGERLAEAFVMALVATSAR
jgi:hypothetical protein